MEAGIGLVITTIITPLVLFKSYLLHKKNKDYERRLGISKK